MPQQPLAMTLLCSEDPTRKASAGRGRSSTVRCPAFAVAPVVQAFSRGEQKMKRVAAFACLLLLASHVNAGPVEDALAAYDKFFAAFCRVKQKSSRSQQNFAQQRLETSEQRLN